MSKKETTVRTIVANVLIWGGLLVMIAAIGQLDYLAEIHAPYTIADQWISLGKGVAGLVMAVVGAYVGRNLEFEDEGRTSEKEEDKP